MEAKKELRLVVQSLIKDLEGMIPWMDFTELLSVEFNLREAFAALAEMNEEETLPPCSGICESCGDTRCGAWWMNAM